MTTQVLSHPGADEYAPYYNTYIAPVAGTNALETLVTQIGALDPLRSLGDAQTLHRWRTTFESRAAEVEALGFDETFRRMWSLYLAYSEAGFRTRYLDVAQFTLTTPA